MVAESPAPTLQNRDTIGIAKRLPVIGASTPLGSLAAVPSKGLPLLVESYTSRREPLTIQSGTSSEVAVLRSSYVYLLKADGVVVYVGQTNTPHVRIVTHQREGVKVFDSWEVKSVDPCFSSDEEAELIFVHQPKYNKLVPDCRAFWTLNSTLDWTRLTTKGLEALIREGKVEVFRHGLQFYFSDADVFPLYRVGIS